MTLHATTASASHSLSRLDRQAAVLPALFAIAFGAFLVFGIGFAHPEAIHNAAHDSRHSFAFPCH